MHIATCIPTRGIIFAQTISSLLLELAPFQEKSIYIVEGLPLPESHNECVRRALKGKATHILFLEEDMVIPEYGLARMATIAANGAQYVTIEYALEGGQSIMRLGSDVLWSGLGCTLIDISLFERKGEPFFTNDKTISYTGGKMELLNQTNKYGGHDVLFGLWLKEQGIPITIVPNMQCKHLRLASWERKTVNEGVHAIYSL